MLKNPKAAIISHGFLTRAAGMVPTYSLIILVFNESVFTVCPFTFFKIPVIRI
jgi:hypothetical protein